jgi:hypothetical protein
MPAVAKASAPAPAQTGRSAAPPAASRAFSRSTTPPFLATAPPVLRLGGKAFYITSDGRMVELPPDITVEEAVRLEAEAKAAEQKLGKGPPPKPVPDVKKLVPKEEKKAAKPETKGKREFKRKGKAGPKAGSARTAVLKVVSSSKVAQYLVSKATPVLRKGFGMLQRLRQNEQTHDDAAEKLTQSEKAVVIPPADCQSKSNAGQVNTVSGRQAPAVDELKPKQKLQESLEENVPRSIEDVDNFKRDKKARHMGADVMKVVQTDKNAVSATFGEMEKTPAPAPPEHTPEEIPPEGGAPATSNMNLGQGAIAPLQQEHTDVSKYTKEADSKLTEEGVTQEQLDMVDSGELAEANKEKKGMEKTAKAEPLAIQKFAQQETSKVDQDLKQEEKIERDRMKAKRKADLGATAQKQKGAKSSLEKKREEVASKINGIYQAAQDKVKKRLADLETQSMRRFDEGNAKATKEFEDTVARELDAFKEDRYSGWFGWARRARDWIKGIDDLPAVKAIFDRNRDIFVRTIDKLVSDITADNKRVIQECKDELANAKQKIKGFVDSLEPGLKGIGKKAAGEMDAKLDELDKFVAKKEQELQDKLQDKQTAAIKAIDEKIEKMKEAMSGALAKLGKLLLWAAKKFFTWALEKVGFSLADIEGIINKGVAVLKAIFTKPIQFVKNLMNAAITGFKNFGKNFLKYLKDALFEWLTGSLEGLVLPQTWDFQGIIGVALQMIGISYQNIRKHMVTVMGEPVVAGLEKTFTLVRTLITKGPMAAWDQLQDMAAEMRDAFIEAVKDFIKTKIIEQAIQWLVSLFVPGAGIIKAIIGIYDTIVFFIKKAKQIMQMISNFLGSISEIAAGNIGAAADAMEKGLARGLSLVIAFLAQLLRLTGVTNKIRDALQKIRAKVDAVLLKLAKWIAEKGKALFAGAGKLKDKAVAKIEQMKGKIANWWGTKKNFRGKDDKIHTIYFSGSGKSAKLVVASASTGLEELITKRESKALTPDQAEALKAAWRKKQELDAFISAHTTGGPTDEANLALQAEIDIRLEEIRQLAIKGDLVTGSDSNLPLTNVTYSMSGNRSHTVKAEPLSKLPGNTTGEEASGSLTTRGWDLVQEINSSSYIINSETGKPETTSEGRLRLSKPWKRVHLLSHRLHGPFKVWNVVPALQAVNSYLLGRVEDPTDKRLRNSSVLSFTATVTYRSEADKIEITDIEGNVLATALASDYPESIMIRIGERSSEQPAFTNFKEIPVPGTELPKADRADFSFTIKRFEGMITQDLATAKAENTPVHPWYYYYPAKINLKMRTRIGKAEVDKLGIYYKAELARLGLITISKK